MTFPDPEAIELTTDELLVLRNTCDLVADAESAFGRLEGKADATVLETGARSLVAKGLADKKTYRPHREVIRRVLVAAQPDSRIVLLAAGPGSGERLLDIYVRAGAFVRYSRSGDTHRFGTPLQYVDVFDEVVSHFVSRASTGDFIDLRLTPPEYFAFSSAASELAQMKASGQSNIRLDSRRPARNLGDSTMDGAVLMPGGRNRFAPNDPPSLLPVPNEEEWTAAIHGLAEKGVISKGGATYQLRGYLLDLALGLATRTRHVLTRFDFGGPSDGSRAQLGHWFVRDATLVPVPGSLFWIRPTHEGGLRIREVDRPALETAVRSAIEDIHAGKTADY